MNKSLLITLAWLGGLSAPALATELQAEIPLTVTNAKGEERTINRGESLALEEGAAMILSSPGHVPMVLVPVTPGSEKISVKLKPWGADSLPADLWKSVDKLISDIVQVQHLMRQQRNRDALALATDLEAKYPSIRQLKLLKASCYMLMGQRAPANALIQEEAAAKPIPAPPTEEAKKTPQPAKTSPDLNQEGNE